MPTLIINGDNDTMVPTSNSYQMHELIKNSELLIFPNAGHGSIFQYAIPAAEKISSFLNDNLAPQLNQLDQVDVVLDYLWGLPAQNVLNGVLNSRSKPNTLLKWVEIGSMAGSKIELSAAVLRSNNIRFLGSGIGSIATAVFAKELFSLAQLVAAGKFYVTPLQYQLEEFSQENWENTKQRIVYIPNQFN